MKIGIIGAGAVGVYLAAHINSPGSECYVLARSLTLKHAKTNGFEIITDSDVLSFPCNLILDSNNPQRIFDIIIVTVKRYSNEEIAELIPLWLKPKGHVLTLQNGVEADSVLEASLCTKQSISVGTILACLRRDKLTKVVQDKGSVTTIKLDGSLTQTYPAVKLLSQS